MRWLGGISCGDGGGDGPLVPSPSVRIRNLHRKTIPLGTYCFGDCYVDRYSNHQTNRFSRPYPVGDIRRKPNYPHLGYTWEPYGLPCARVSANDKPGWDSNSLRCQASQNGMIRN